MTERQKKSVAILCDVVKANGLDKLTPVQKAAYDNLTVGAPSRDSFKELFGDKKEISELDAFTKFHKGPSEMKRCIKAWEKKGIIVALEGGKYIVKEVKEVKAAPEKADDIKVEGGLKAPKAAPKK